MAKRLTETDPQAAALEVIPLLDELSPTMCMAKWLWSSIHLTTGLTNSCFLPPLHKIDADEVEQNFKALHNTKQKKQERAEMLSGGKPSGCSTCWKVEAMQGDHLSDRFYRSSEPWAQEGWNDVLAKGADGDIEPRYLEVNFNHACNLACSYCSPHLSSKWAEDIERNGPYPTKVPHNSIEYFKETGQYPIPVKEHNPYVEAFWKWWPTLYPKLKHFRMTGGEPLLDKNTFRVLDYVVDNGRPDLDMSITTNASVPEKNWNRFVDTVGFITEYDKLNSFRLFVSVDGWGEQAEYMRDGLDFDLLWNNVNNYLANTHNGLVTFIVTFNMLSLPSIRRLLEGIHALQKAHNVRKVRRDENTGKLISYGNHRVFVDTPALHHPAWQSLKLAPQEHWHYAEEALDYMKANLDGQRDTRWTGFKPHQISRFERSIEFMKEGFTTDQERIDAQQNFVKFFTEYDKRRGINFENVFPEFKGLMDKWNKD